MARLTSNDIDIILEGIDTPVSDTDAANKAYVDNNTGSTLIDYTTTVAIPDNNLVAYNDNVYVVLRELTEAAAWSSSTSYAVGDQAAHSNKRWIALVANSNSEPTDTNTNWADLTPAYQNDYWSQINDGVYEAKPIIARQANTFTKVANANSVTNGQFGYGSSIVSRRFLIRATGGDFTRADKVADYWKQGAQLTVVYRNPSDPIDGNNGTYHYRLGHNTFIDSTNNLFESDLGEFLFNSKGDSTDILRSSGNLTAGYTFTVTTLGDNAITDLNDIDDVHISSVADNQFLRYNSTNERWENETVSFGSDLTAGDGIVIDTGTDPDTISVDYDNSSSSIAVASKQYVRTEFIEDLDYVNSGISAILTSGTPANNTQMRIIEVNETYELLFHETSSFDPPVDNWKYVRVEVGSNTGYYAVNHVISDIFVFINQRVAFGTDVLNNISNNTAATLAYASIGAGNITDFGEFNAGIVPATGDGKNTDDYVLYGDGEWAEPYAVYNPQSGYTAPRATGNDGLAAGHTALASGASSVALGLGTDATAFHTTAIGAGAQATSNNSTALGYNAATTASSQIMLGGGQRISTPDGYNPLQSEDVATKQYVDTHPGVIHYVDVAHPSEIASVGTITDDVVYDFDSGDTTRIDTTINFQTGGYYNFPVDTDTTLDADYFAEVSTTHGNVQGVIFEYTGDHNGTVTFPSSYTFNYSLDLNGFAITTSHITVAWDLVVWSGLNPDTSLSDFNSGTLLASTGASENISGAVNTIHTGALTMTSAASKLTLTSGDFVGLRFHIRMGNGQAYNVPSDVNDRWVMTHQRNSGQFPLTTRVVHTDPVSSLSIASDGVVTWSDLDSDPNITNIIINSGGTIPTGAIQDMAVTTAKLDDLGVTTGKLAADAVTQAKIGPAAVSTTELADDAVETAKLNDNAVSTAKIANDAVTYPKIDVAGTAGQVLTVNSAGNNWEWTDSTDPTDLNYIAFDLPASPADAEAFGDNSIAIGNDAQTGTDADNGADGAIALGAAADATANGGIAIGIHTTASGQGSVAIGGILTAADAATVTAADAIGIGNSTDVSGVHAVAIGSHSRSPGDNAVAIGGSNSDSDAAQAAGASSVAIGRNSFVSSTATNSVALGAGVESTAANQILLGTSTHTVQLGRETLSSDTTNQVVTKGYADALEGVNIVNANDSTDTRQATEFDWSGTTGHLNVPLGVDSFPNPTNFNAANPQSNGDLRLRINTANAADDIWGTVGTLRAIFTSAGVGSSWTVDIDLSVPPTVTNDPGDPPDDPAHTLYLFASANITIVSGTFGTGDNGSNATMSFEHPLTDVDLITEVSLTNDIRGVATGSTGQVLTRTANGLNWTTVSQQGDIGFGPGTPSAGQAGVTFNDSDISEVTATITQSDIDLANLGDVDIATPTTGQALVYSSDSKWENTTIDTGEPYVDIDVNSGDTTPNVTGSRAIGIGPFAVNSGESGIAIGRGASVTADEGMAYGRGAAVSAENSIALGRAASVDSSSGIAIGYSADVNNIDSIAIGRNASTTVSNELVIGGPTGPNGGISRIRVGLTDTSDYDIYADLPNSGLVIKRTLADNFYTRTQTNDTFVANSDIASGTTTLIPSANFYNVNKGETPGSPMSITAGSDALYEVKWKKVSDIVTFRGLVNWDANNSSTLGETSFFDVTGWPTEFDLGSLYDWTPIGQFATFRSIGSGNNNNSYGIGNIIVLNSSTVRFQFNANGWYGARAFYFPFSGSFTTFS